MVFALALLTLVHVAPAPLTVTRPDGRLALTHGVLSAPVTGELTDEALRFALSRKAELGLGAGSTLVVGDAFSTKLGATVHLKQRVGDVTVWGATAIVTFDAERRVVRVSSTLSPAPATGLFWSLSGGEALKAASNIVEGALLQNDGTPYGGWQPYYFVVEGQLRAGYLTWVPTLKNDENWHLAIDAADGHVIFQQNQVHHATNAKVFASSPGAPGITGTPLIDVELAHFPAGWSSGVLEGENIRSFNCCPTAGCSSAAGAPAKRATGLIGTGGGGTMPYDVAICDRVHRASNDPMLNPNGNFVYAPVDPPTTSSPTAASLADWDTFAEVHAYHHVNKVHDYLSALSVGPFVSGKGIQPFRTFDSRTGRVMAIWTNISDPDFRTATQTMAGLVGNNLVRTDNAMFVRREQMMALSVPDYAFDSDALLLYQGNQADYAYDGPVVWHEFGHGAIRSTADWNYTVTVDSRSANGESQALHEGNADIIAAMTGNLSNIGAYVGPRGAGGGTGIRDVNNGDKCPDVLWGESHQDSLHYTGAIWEARSRLFQGSDQGKTFDAAFYAALVSFPKDVGFEIAASIVSATVGQAFPGVADAEGQMKAVFDARGVSNCSKVLDLTDNPGPRTYYAIPGAESAQLAMGSVIPGPYQMKFRAPHGVKSVTVSGPSFGGGGGGGMARTRFLVKVGQPITFTRNGSVLTNDADLVVTPTQANGMMNGKAEISVPCGGEVYFTVANTSTRDRTQINMSFSMEQADVCDAPVVPDAGTPVMPEMPMPASPIVLEAPMNALGDVAPGCSAAGGALSLGLLGVVALLRRRRSS
ncbi:MAG: hypothetical protein JNK82_15305 [Myxococcaceae bacterium]|nr:hypothetical protein [Myxococcaceae bacterium]